MKNVLVTGATKGIGLAIAEEFRQLDYRVFCSARNIEKTEFSAPFDLSKKENVCQLYKYVKENFGDIDILINNAGSCVYSPIEKMEEEEIIRLNTLNFLAPYVLCSLAIEDMKKNNWGRIINIGSISGVVGEAYATLYSATKAGLLGLTKSLALEVAQYGITVNQINPGWVETELSNNILDENEKQETLDIIPQRRFVEPYEIAKLCTYLASQDAKGLTGQGINLCAGLSCGA